MLQLLDLDPTSLPVDHDRGRLCEQLGLAQQAREAYVLILNARHQADSVFIR